MPGLQVYKRSMFSMIKGIVGAPFAGIVAIIIVSFFVDNQVILAVIGVATAVAVLFVTLVSEDIRVEVDERELRYFKRSKLSESFPLANLGVGYRTKVERGLLGNEDLTLKLLLLDTGEERALDCSALGAGRFYKLFETLEARTPKREEEVLRA